MVMDQKEVQSLSKIFQIRNYTKDRRKSPKSKRLTISQELLKLVKMETLDLKADLIIVVVNTFMGQ